MSLVPLGLWVAILGYAVAYAGMAKLGGDPTYSIGKALRGVAPGGTSEGPGPAGTTSAQQAQQAQQASMSTIGTQPIPQGLTA